MIYKKLPGTNIDISLICLGTMTWGEQNTEKEAHEQLDFAMTEGINFIDTAELYAIPINPKTQGLTESYIGNWLVNQDREKIILASKISGPGPKHIRNNPNYSEAHIREAIEGSLRRLQTDYIDLYQLHWPERITNRFGKLNYTHQSETAITDFKRVLEIFAEYIEKGQIRYIGISNETPWGTSKYLQIAEQYDLPRIRTIQNAYSLVNRTYEIGASEISHRENIGLLAYSPLAGGLLTGKYLDNRKPEGARYTKWPNYFARYAHPNTSLAVESYAKLAADNSLSLTQMALAFVNSRPFVSSNIIGATSIPQLKENIDSVQVELDEKIIRKIEKIHLKYPNPAP